jgi:FkbM family methyltransferase
MAGKLASQIRKLPRIWRAAHYCQEYLDHYNHFSYDYEINGEKHLLKKLSSLNPKTIFDVGCHTGTWTKAALKQAKTAEFYCFDIAEDSLKQARESLSANKSVKLSLAAISDSDGTIQFRDYGSQSQLNTTLLESSWTEPGNAGKISNIRSIKGDTYCKDNNISFIDFLKLDCEGADHRALKGFTSMLKANKIRLIQFEYGYTNGDAKFLMRDFFELFGKYGYILAPLRPCGLSFEDWKYEFNDFKSGPNWVAIIAEDTEINRLLRE